MVGEGPWCAMEQRAREAQSRSENREDPPADHPTKTPQDQPSTVLTPHKMPWLFLARREVQYRGTERRESEEDIASLACPTNGRWAT